jgi:hypothetical protein
LCFSSDNPAASKTSLKLPVLEMGPRIGKIFLVQVAGGYGDVRVKGPVFDLYSIFCFAEKSSDAFFKHSFIILFHSYENGSGAKGGKVVCCYLELVYRPGQYSMSWRRRISFSSLSKRVGAMVICASDFRPTLLP